MAVTGIIHLSNARRQFQGVFDNVIEYEAIYDPANIGSNGSSSETISIPGARLGDIVLLSIEADQQNLIIDGYVNVNDTVTINTVNPTAGAINLGAVDLHIIVLRPTHIHP